MNVSIRRGMFLRHEGHVYQVADFNEHHSGKQKPTVHVALRDIRDGRPVDRSLADLEPVREVECTLRPMQYLYHKGSDFVFMDCETFEEVALAGRALQGREAFLSEGTEYRVMHVDGAPMTVEMPEIIALKVANTAAPAHGGGQASSITKEATLENKLEIRVPLFIKTGDVIKVDTRTKTYAGKDHG